jgi:hypothetical protein
MFPTDFRQTNTRADAESLAEWVIKQNTATANGTATIPKTIRSWRSSKRLLSYSSSSPLTTIVTRTKVSSAKNNNDALVLMHLVGH